ncbi:hypothetical protein [Thalassoroseus pseudoceratinae]|uniref:hypothetical protein n=1 Tax=Thalassoroseus pseudoceratinae TaxID=2713176 RepID=UPI00141DC3E0|nr:hypothetical protein [Thalassoroseus pseudoceratinae]
MAQRKTKSSQAAAGHTTPVANISLMGYLNFSRGEANAEFQRGVNDLCRELGPGWRPHELRDSLLASLEHAPTQNAAFQDVGQAKAVIDLTLNRLLPTYREFHHDLLFHLSDEDFAHPFLLTRMFEAVLSQGPSWDETERIVQGALDQLNDYLGYRPLAVLENGQQMQPYPHERFRPAPLYIRDAGVAFGPYEELITRTLEFFERTPASIQQSSFFDLAQLDEIALDLRAHDHLHPANKRTNYMFGEWDPHLIDSKGYFKRFVLRKVILDALLTWMTDAARRQRGIGRDELLHDASAVLCGTMLMASSISGSGPGMHDSLTTLTSLLPKVARQRDAFYERLLQEASGARAKRLKREARLTQQPFGHVRQRLNIELAKYGARQVQTRHLGQLYARMGYYSAARKQALAIPVPSARFECEIQCLITETHLRSERGELTKAVECVRSIEDMLHRGIECGALIDPWNILGFQGQFPLFHTREDSLHDMRAESLIEMMERIFRAHSHALTESAARGNSELGRELSQRFGRLADWWDRFATTVVEDLPDVSGAESVSSARHVAAALSEWQTAGAEAGDISFWRQHVDDFQSSKAYAVVVDALLERSDRVAALGLLMQWLSETEDIGLESGTYSLTVRLVRWMRLVTDDAVTNSDSSSLSTVVRLFALLEANAEHLWQPPSLGDALGYGSTDDIDEDSDEHESLDDAYETGDWDDDDDEQDELFGAAYDDVVFKDSADDGFDSDTVDEGNRSGDTAIEQLADQLEPRLRFLETLAQLWEMAAQPVAERLRNVTEPLSNESDALLNHVQSWIQHVNRLQRGLQKLMTNIWDFDILPSSGDPDSNVEYDEQVQTQFYLVQTIMTTAVGLQGAERSLRSCIPVGINLLGESRKRSAEETAILEVYRGILTRKPTQVQQALPRLLKHLSRKPLLYVPLSNDGDPELIRQVQGLQSLIRFLLAQLPGLGLLRETWQVLQTAFRMERSSRPMGQAVTEFDQLFRIALRSSVDSVIRSSSNWQFNTKQPRSSRRRRSQRQQHQPRIRHRRRRGLNPRRQQRTREQRNAALVEIVSVIVQQYSGLWLKHSQTTRLSTVEGLADAGLWKDVKDFIRRYGADLFHARMLTLGNVRTILHSGVDLFLDYLEETADPLRPMKLIDDMDDGTIDRDQVVEYLELIYGTLVDRIDRFVEYNSTTTQSDYGEKFYCLLDFLRAEAAYERDAWNLTPFVVAHEQLAAHAEPEVARLWESVFARRNQETAEQHVLRLQRLEKLHGMHLPALTDRIEERFVKPLAVNRMLALVEPAVEDARNNRQPSAAFEALREEIQNYLESTSGSGIDVAPWLRNIEKEVELADPFGSFAERPFGPRRTTDSVRLNLPQLHRQLRRWMKTRKRAGGK